MQLLISRWRIYSVVACYSLYTTCCSLLVMKITLCYYFVEKFASFSLHKLLVIYCKNKKSLQYFLIIDYKNSFFTLCENCLLDFAKVVLFSFESQFLQVSWCKIAVYSSQNILIMLFFWLYVTFDAWRRRLWQKQTEDL